MQASKLYANSITGLRQNKLLSTDRAKRMIDAPTVIDAVKILYECGYNEGIILDNPDNIDLLLSDEMANAVKFFSELCPDRKLFNCSMIKFDYHNFKLLIKKRHAEVDENAGLYPFGRIPKQKIEKMLETKKYDDSNPYLLDALKQIDKLEAEEKIDSRQIDIIFDKAMFSETAQAAKGIGNAVIRKFFKAEADMVNLSVMARCRLSGIDINEAKNQTVEGGTLDGSLLTAVYTLPLPKLRDKFANTPYYNIIKDLQEGLEQKSLSVFEAVCEEYVQDILTADKNNIFSTTPLFAFYQTKLNELKKIKLILTCKNNNIPKEIIRHKLKDIFENP